MELNNKKIALIGAGRLGEIIISGLLESKLISNEKLIATVRRKTRLTELKEKYKIEITMDNSKAVKEADIIIMCIKPHNFMSVLDIINNDLNKDKCIISTCAAVPIKKIKEKINKGVSVLRAMPNTPSKVLKGMTAICHPAELENGWVKIAEQIFSSLGRTIILPEHYFNMVTGLSASGPAFVYIMIEAIVDGGVKVGLPRDIATELAAQMVLGSAEMVLQTGEHPAKLKDMVTTPAGSTIDGILELEEGGLRVTMIKAIVKAVQRAGELFPDD